MGSITNFLEDELLDHVFNAAFSPATSLFLALCTQDPTDAATGASMFEVANANGYTRKPLTFSAAASRRVVQSGAITFDQASGAGWGTITHWAIVTSATYGSGTVYAHGSFLAPFTPVAGNTPTVPDLEVEVEFQPSSGAGFTDFLAHALLNFAFRNQAFAKPATYVGLATSVLTDTTDTIGEITEVSTSGTNYARKQVNPNGGAAPTWDISAGGTLDNTHDIVFNTPSASWGLVVAMFIIDSASGAGNILCFDSANIVDQTPVASDTVLFPAGALDLTIS